MQQRSKSGTAKSLCYFMVGSVAIAAMLSLRSSAQTLPQDASQSRTKREVVVSIPDRKLAVLENGMVLRTFLVSVGASQTPSPTGKFTVINRLADPTYYHSGVVIPPGKTNPLGPRWFGLNQPGYGIHGTSAPSSIGKARSHGCIRMRNRDIVEFASLVNVGDTVEIRGGRDEEIARIFGGSDGAGTAVAQAQATSVATSGQ
jgi:hypothetical protein